jgi:hypothetical protein
MMCRSLSTDEETRSNLGSLALWAHRQRLHKDGGADVSACALLGASKQCKKSDFDSLRARGADARHRAPRKGR